uniref:Uncharacterized protein n=1 Tax=Anguilla anguilla TaxID=7936 RepID=A0A0E9SSG3_ANGAN
MTIACSIAKFLCSRNLLASNQLL